MEVRVERLDHLGVVAGTIKELGIVDMINTRVGTSKQEIVSTGEAVAAMILNNLGFANAPLYLSPNFFSDKALDNLFGREDIEAKNFNPTKLSNSLDAVHAYGLERLFMEIAVSACKIENINVQAKSLDTTSLSLTGEYDRDSDEHTIKVTHGFSKDNRPDLKQVIIELLVSQDGGVPLMLKTWDGNAADTKIFKERTKAIIEQLKNIDMTEYLIADSKLYTSDNAENLSKLKFITRIPNSNKQVINEIKAALELNEWLNLNNQDKYQVIEIEHYGIKQRWIIVYSTAANSRAQKRSKKKINAEAKDFVNKIKALNKQKYSSQEDFNSAILNSIKKLHFHQAEFDIEEVKTKDGLTVYQAIANLIVRLDKEEEYIQERSCYVIGSNAGEELSAEEIINKYKKQNSSIENTGFRFLKDPLFFASSLFVKLPRRIEALIFIMTLSLLVYSIAQRKLRVILEEKDIVVPDQLNRPSKRPTIRWIFQILNGINVVYITVSGIRKKIIEGIDLIKSNIINLFGVGVREIYEIKT